MPDIFTLARVPGHGGVERQSLARSQKGAEHQRHTEYLHGGDDDEDDEDEEGAWPVEKWEQRSQNTN